MSDPIVFDACCPCGCGEVVLWTARLTGPTPSLCTKARTVDIPDRVDRLMEVVR